MTQLIQMSTRCEVIYKKVIEDMACDSPGIRLLCTMRWTVVQQPSFLCQIIKWVQRYLVVSKTGEQTQQNLCP